LEAFSDGVLDVIITIMVLEMKSPHVASLASLWSVFLSYILSFGYIGIYWNNHHHVLHATQRVNVATLWANLHLLFWLSLVPFTTAWMGENHFDSWPVAVYGIVLLLAAIAYSFSQGRSFAFTGTSQLWQCQLEGTEKEKSQSQSTRLQFRSPSRSRGLLAHAMQWLQSCG